MKSIRNLPGGGYFAFDRALGNRDERTVANNTRLIRRRGAETEAIALRLHSTDVVTFCLDGRIVLATGGWNTVTTRQRINAALHGTDFRVGTERRALMLYRFGTLDERTRYEWDDSRVTILPDGSVLGATLRPYRVRRCGAPASGPQTFVRRPTPDPDPEPTNEQVRGSADAQVPETEPMSALVEEARWAEYNRKFNAMIYGRES